MRQLIAKMQPCISVLTHISSDVTQPSLYLTAKNGQKYLIGRIGEGFQRIIGEQSVRTSKLSGVFLTGPYHWDSVSGLPGMLLSFADRALGINKLYTGPGLPEERASQMIQSWNNFTFHQPITIEATSATYSDENVEIQPFSVRKDSTSFLVQLKPVRGKFLVEKAKALGVPPGKLFGQLSEGNAVTIPGTGKIVHPGEVLGPSPTPARVIVLDLPTMDHVQAALDQAQLEFALRPLPCTEHAGYDLRAVYYFFGKDVDLNSSDVSLLIDRLSAAPDTKHYISHPETSPDYNTLHTIAEFQSVFRTEFPEHFSLLYSQPAKQSLPHFASSTHGDPQQGSPGHNVRRLEQQHILSVCPRENDEELSAPKRKKKAKITQELEPPETKSTEPVAGRPLVLCDDLAEPEIITLGTGASAPSKYRNVSGTLVRSSFGSFLFDCGEATSNTLTRIFGPHGRASLLQELRLLYISHMHADHHLGAQQVLRAWLSEAAENGGETRKLVLAAPFQFHNFINHWAQIDGYKSELEKYVYQLDLDSVCIGKRYSSHTPVTQADLDAVANEAGLNIMACTAIHCSYSYNGSVTVPTGAGDFKVSYSGDTRPNRFFAQHVGHDSDLLIHEATHENELAEEALKKRHSTINEALGIARLMNAKNTILTHISQRYPRLPTLGEGDNSVGENQFVCFGFDAMHTKLSEIKDIQKMVPKMSAMFELLEVANATDTSDAE